MGPILRKGHLRHHQHPFCGGKFFLIDGLVLKITGNSDSETSSQFFRPIHQGHDLRDPSPADALPVGDVGLASKPSGCVVLANEYVGRDAQGVP